MKLSPFARPSPWVYREERDGRCDCEKFEDAIERHLSNAGLCASLLAAPVSVRLPGWVEAAKRAERAFDDSQAELFRLVEDLIGVDPVRLGKALLA